MIYYINNFSNKNQDKLFDFLSKRCDAFYLSITNPYIHRRTEKNQNLFEPIEEYDEDIRRAIENDPLDIENIEAYREARDNYAAELAVIEEFGFIDYGDPLNYMRDYLATIQPILEKLEPYLIKKSTDVESLGNIYENDITSMIYKLEKGSMDVIRRFDIFDWRDPKLPEELSFFNDNECFLRVIISYYTRIVIFPKSEEDIIFIENMGCSYTKSDKETIIKVDYSL